MCARQGWSVCRWANLVVIAGFLGGACAGLAGMIEVAAVHGRANEALNSGYGYVGILVAFLSRQSPLGILVISLLVGGLLASGGMLQRAHDLPDATITVLQGILFLFILLSDTVYGRWRVAGGEGRCSCSLKGSARGAWPSRWQAEQCAAASRICS